MNSDLRTQDKKVVEQILAGDTVAVRKLYADVRIKLEKYFKNQVQHDEDADELVQDTFLHLLDALPLFQYQSSLVTFLMGIAHHELMDYWRKKYAKRVIKTVPLLKSMPIRTQSSVDTSAQIHSAMQKAYGQLKPLQARLLRLKYEEDKSVKEIAELMGMTRKAVETQLYRARKAFQEHYHQEGLLPAFLEAE